MKAIRACFNRLTGSTRRQRRAPTAGAALVERFESRCYLSVTSVFDADTGALTVRSNGRDAIAIGSDVDGQVTINGAATASPIAASAVTSLSVSGGSGNNRIDLSGVTAEAFTALTSVAVHGGNGNDHITGSPFGDSISGGNGNDTILGQGGNDSLFGNNGADVLNGGADNDHANGGNAGDTITGGSGDDSLFGGSANDQVSGGEGHDSIHGGQGNDTIQGNDGNDQLVGGANNDRIEGGSGNDQIEGNLGNDTLSGGDGDDSMIGGSGNDSMSGGVGHDHLQAGNGNDRANGDDGDDTIFGGAGQDSLTSGEGADVVIGGSGSELIVADVSDTVVEDGANHDAGAPVAVEDSSTVDEGGSANISVLDNDTDELPAAGLHVIPVSNPAHGSLTLNADGTFTYQHDGSENFSDSFTYKVNDGLQDSNIVTVTITVTPVNDNLPVSGDDNTEAETGATISISVLDNDSDDDLPGDILTVIKLSDPEHGTATVNPDGTVTYVHDGGDSLSDSFTYKLNDGVNDGNVATVMITITPPAAPV